MRLVLPGESDAAEHLNAVLCRVDSGIQRHRGGHCCGDRKFVARLGSDRTIPGDGSGILYATQHFGADVFDRLERADGLSELFANLRVLHRSTQAPRRNSGSFGSPKYRR